jgi:formate hydrogenlyase transcriptional activator
MLRVELIRHAAGIVVSEDSLQVSGADVLFRVYDRQMLDAPTPVAATRVWTSDALAALGPGLRLEDHLLTAIRKLTSSLDVPGVCEAVLSGVEAVFGATSSWIVLHDPTADLLRSVVFRGRGAEVYREMEIPLSEGIAGRVFRQREVHFIPDAASETRWYNADRVRASGLRSVLLVPLVTGEAPIGVLGLDSPRFDVGRPPTDVEVRQIELFAAQASIGIINARLYETSQQDRARLRALLRERRDLRQEVLGLREVVREAYSFGPIIGSSAGMQAVLRELAQVAASDVTVLLLGETGTGKELLARALHERSGRSSRSFVPVNCAALPESLVESEMFGHERGAFTGALARKPGRFELAHRGTLFLDEVGDLPLNAQAKLLRVLQDGELLRVGGTQPIRVDVRLVAATNRDLLARVGRGEFREDLYYRLSVFPIRVPPLRERLDDIPLLAQHFAHQCAAKMRRPLGGMEQTAMDSLSQYSWPGNVRELQNVIERAVILMRDDVLRADTIRLEGPPLLPRPAAPPGSLRTPAPDPPPNAKSLADAEREAILQALKTAEGRVSGAGGAAALLGLKPTTLHAKMKKLGIRRQDGFPSVRHAPSPPDADPRP